MMRKYWTIALALAALSAPLAHAEQDEHRGPQPHRRGGEERMFRMQRQEQPMPAQMQPMQAPAPAHHGRMSPEERRQLRRDIDAAGRELYQPPSQRH